MRIVGIDLGIRGGLAIVEINDGAAPRLVDAIDIPVAGVGAKERVDPIAIPRWVDEHRPQHTLIERAQAMPKHGSSTRFKYGRAVGAIEAAIACCGIPMRIIEPTVWKKFHRVCRGDKEGGRQLALLARKKDHGRAEAADRAHGGILVWEEAKS